MLGFLDLPFGLRVIVYRLLFYSANCKIPIYLGSKQNAMTLNRSFNTTIFRLNRFVYQEAMEEIYSMNDFYVRPFTQENCLSSLSPIACQHIRRLRIDLDGSREENGTFQAIWTCALQRLSRLEEICLLFPHTSSYLLETIVAVSEFIVNPAASSGRFYPLFKLNLSVIPAAAKISPIHNAFYDSIDSLPSCAQDLGPWTNVDLYDSKHKRSRVFDMDVPERQTKPNILIRASTDQHEIHAIQHYSNEGWSFSFNRPVCSKGLHKGSRYLAEFRKPATDASSQIRSQPSNAIAEGDVAADTGLDRKLPIRAIGR